ncbi:MAG: type VI secretion system tip protein TssI/VgrG [bacterium]
MSYLTAKKFSFLSSALAPDTFAVVSFEGFEALSKPYEFEVMLVSEEGNLDLNSILQQPGKFIFHREEGGDVEWNGIVAQFEQLQNYNIYYFYRARLVPKLWWLQLTYHNQIFLDKSVKDIIEEVLKDGSLSSSDFGFKLQGSYPKIDYVCQYEESHYDFFSRWLEREGLYYYFEQTNSGEKVIITDTKISHVGMAMGDTLYYSPPSGLDFLQRNEIIQSLVCRQTLIPNQVFMKDYNYETPSLTISGSATVDPSGRGNVYYYGEGFKTSAEGNRLAKIRAEEIFCRKEQYFGESTVPFVVPGYCFKLQGHYRNDYNQEYLTTSVNFRGHQTGYLISGIQAALTPQEEQVYYHNSFVAIPSSVQFRTERRTKKAKIYGTLPAKIDAAGSGQYAEIDTQGRYKVILPLDQSGRSGGKASIWLRMMQPHAGPDFGMHFPLHKDTEVMIAFYDGDPDRPFIAGSIPNPETSSPITEETHTKNRMKTKALNEMMMEDKQGEEMIHMTTPHTTSNIYMGAPASIWDGIRATTRGWGVLHAHKGIYINGWPVDYDNTTDARSNRGIARQVASNMVKAAKDAEAGKLESFDPVEADTPFVAQVLRPGILLAAPNSIVNVTPETFLAVGLKGIALWTPASADIVAEKSAAIMSKGEVDIFSKDKIIKIVTDTDNIEMVANKKDVKVTGEENVTLTAKKKDITIEAQTENICITAVKAITIDSTSDEITVKAVKKITLQCGGSTITLEPAQIVINAPIVKIN